MPDDREQLLREIDRRITRLLRGRPPTELKSCWYERYQQLKAQFDALKLGPSR
jgi:hypothetical protein